MISQFFLVIVKILVMLLILMGMVLVLVGLQHYLSRGCHGDMDDSDNQRFKREIDSDTDVLSRYNLFHRFLSDDDEIPRFFGGSGIRASKRDYNRVKASLHHKDILRK